MAKGMKLDKGDQVFWSSHGQTVPGKVKKKVTERADVAGRTAGP
ncbi:HVA1 family protein [Streptomyces sp. NPDC055239]